MINLFADMGVQPGSIQPGLVAATASTLTTPPTSTITSPASGLVLPLMMSIIVVLPAPFGPMMARISPG